MNSEALVPANPDILDGVDDLMQLSYLNEPSVLYNLQYRYDRDMIYVSIYFHDGYISHILLKSCSLSNIFLVCTLVCSRQKQGLFWLPLIPLRKFHCMEMITLKHISVNPLRTHMYMPSQIQPSGR